MKVRTEEYEVFMKLCIGTAFALLSLLLINSLSAGDRVEPDLPKLAIICSFEDSEYDYFDDLLHAEFNHQNTFQLVDRKNTEKIFNEFSLSSYQRKGESVEAGSWKGFDYLLSLKGAGEGKYRCLLIHLLKGVILYEEERPFRKNLELSAVEVREQTIRSLKGKILSDNSMTIGIGAVFNQSGSPKSDSVGPILSQALRDRFRQEPWAFTLERQYPKELLSEMELSREGFASRSFFKLPQADLVITGTYIENLDNQNVLDFKMKFLINTKKNKLVDELNLSIKQSEGYSVLCDKILAKAIEMRTFSKKGVVEETRAESEVLRLRKAARYSMLGKSSLIKTERMKNDNLLALRLYQNILLLKGDDFESELSIARCKFLQHRASFRNKSGNQDFGPDDSKRRIRFEYEMTMLFNMAKKLLKKYPSTQADTFYFIVAGRLSFYTKYNQNNDLISPTIEMLEFILKHKNIFLGWRKQRLDIRLAHLTEESPFAEVDKYIESIKNNPAVFFEGIANLGLSHAKKNIDFRKDFYKKYSSHSEQLVEYVANMIHAETYFYQDLPECILYYQEALKIYDRFDFSLKNARYGVRIFGSGRGPLYSAIKAFKKYKEPYLEVLKLHWKPFLETGVGAVEENVMDTFDQLMEKLKELGLHKEGLLYAETMNREKQRSAGDYWLHYFRSSLNEIFTNPAPVVSFLKKSAYPISVIVGGRIWLVLRSSRGPAGPLRVYDPNTNKTIKL